MAPRHFPAGAPADAFRGPLNTTLAVPSGAGPPPAAAPVNITPPSIDIAVVGQSSTCNPGNWTGTHPITYAYQWEVASADVGTDSPNYTPVTDDAGSGLKCVVTATNSVGSIPTTSNVIVVSGAGASIDIPDVTALNAAFAAWPSTGDMTWRLTGDDYGGFFDINHDFQSAPIVIDGLGSARFQFYWSVSNTGITYQNFTAYGVNGDTSIAAADSDVAPCNVTFNNVVSDSGSPEGTQSGNGWLIEASAATSSVTINGAGAASSPDITGRANAMLISNCFGGATIVVNEMTVTNNGVDGIVVAGSENVTINACLFCDFYNSPGDHPDAIQFFSASGNPCTNITVTNNGIYQGLNGVGSQGIFMEDVVNMTLRDNWVMNGGYVTAYSNARGTTCLYDNNFAQGISGVGGAQITRGGAVNTTLTDNTAVSFSQLDGPNPGYSASGSVTIADASSVTDFAELDP